MPSINNYPMRFLIVYVMSDYRHTSVTVSKKGVKLAKLYASSNMPLFTHQILISVFYRDRITGLIYTKPICERLFIRPFDDKNFLRADALKQSSWSMIKLYSHY